MKKDCLRELLRTGSLSYFYFASAIAFILTWSVLLSLYAVSYTHLDVYKRQAFYDAQVPVPLIYPPHYRAVILGRKQPNETITVDYFDETLTNNDNTLKLNVSPATDIVGSNGQPFRCSLADRLLIVYYTNSTKSIPAQIVPRKIIVMCWLPCTKLCFNPPRHETQYKRRQLLLPPTTTFFLFLLSS